MRNRNSLALMLGLGLIGAFDNKHREFFEERETRKVNPNGDLFKTSKQGQKTFTYEDGFSCEALNQKSADKKHSKWLKSKSIT